MSALKPATLEEIQAIAERMQGGHVDALALSEELLDRTLTLPPSRSELLSRPYFERASKWTLVASFIDPPETAEAVPQNIELKRDMVIRGVECQIMLAQTEFPTDAPAPVMGPLAAAYGCNNRYLGEMNFRVDSVQGFQSEGRAEVLERAVRITGDGTFSAPLDWELQMEQTIDVRFRSLLLEFFGAANIDTLGLSIPWVIVTFWGEDRKPGGK